jgi:arginine-tRNA-protein transferase
MESLFSFTTEPSTCGYLPDRDWQLRYEIVRELSADEYLERLKAGWRRFGYSLFRPECPGCRKCLSLRIPVASFKPDRSQRRAAAANDGAVKLVVGRPSVSKAKLALYDRFHRFQHLNRGWPEHAPQTAAEYAESFVENPFDIREWCYYLGDKLVGVGYVDHLTEGLSAIYFFHDPDERDRSLGTYNVLSLIRWAAEHELPHVYLGYYVEDCGSLEYKARFRPNEVLHPDGTWRPFA